MKINDLSYNATGARYGYNSQEQSTELNLDGNHTTAEFWEYDARSARRWNNDPRPVTGISPYATFQGNPIMFSDMKGDSVFVYGGRNDPGASQENVLIDLNTEGISNGLEYSLNGSRLLSNRQDVIGPILEKFQILEDAINDASTNVNLFAGDFRDIIDLNGELGTITLGSFKGNILSENGTREAFQFLNTDDLKLLISNRVVNRGEVVLHELLESYLGATTYLNSSDQFLESHNSVLKIHGSTEFLTKYDWEIIPRGLSNYYEETYYGYNTLNPNNLVPLYKYIPGTKRPFYEMQTILDEAIIQRK